MTKINFKKIVFINQAGGLFFRELVLAAAKNNGPVSYYSSEEVAPQQGLQIIKMPRYKKRNTLDRLFSWGWYFLLANYRVLTEPCNSLLFIVTNPPISPLLGVIAKKLKGQRYILMFYDVYPEAIERFASQFEKSIIVKIWRFLNRLAVQRADSVIVISSQLAETLDQYYSSGIERSKMHIMPTWVDTEHIRAVSKEQNWFAHQFGQVGKMTILYSGNLGVMHDLTMLPEIANRLQEQTDIHFLVTGEGAGKKTLELKCARLGLKNITFLPFQNEATVPFSLSTGDIGIVALAQKGQGISMPSKTYYIMAAGSALMGFSGSDSDIATIVRNYACGVNVEHGDVNGAVRAILELRNNPALLKYYRENARKAAEQHFSKDVCVPKILDLIRDLL